MNYNQIVAAARAGDVGQMEHLAFILIWGENDETGEYVAKDEHKSFYWMSRAAEGWNVEAMFNLSLFYAKGFGTSRSLEHAADWMERAADAGDRDAVKIAREYRTAAENYDKMWEGDIQAKADYASELFSIGGSFTLVDSSATYEEALKLAREAEGKDNGESYFILGRAYEEGKGVRRNLAMAVSYYEKGVAIGHDICLNNLGRMYMCGDGVPKDKKKGFSYFLKSAELGYPVAMENVAQCYQNGDGTVRDYIKAREWLKKASEPVTQK